MCRRVPPPLQQRQAARKRVLVGHREDQVVAQIVVREADRDARFAPSVTRALIVFA